MSEGIVAEQRATGETGMNHARATQPRLLLLAYSCSPDHGSECSVGWHRAIQAARRFNTWVLTLDDPEHREEIERWLAAHPVPSLHFVFVPRSRLAAALRRVPGLYYVAYNLWHRQAFRVGRDLHAQQRFDLIHQATFCSYREPGYLWRLDAPFIWGPVGGTQNVPWRFLPELGFAEALAEGWRSVANRLQLLASPRLRRVARHARVMLAANSTGQRDLARLSQAKPQLLLETGVKLVTERRSRDEPASRSLRILWAGEFRAFKGLSLLLKALAQLPADVPYTLNIMGRGPKERSWRRLARRLGIEPHVRWLGWIPYAEALRQYEQADLFAFTSLRDTSGNVMLEALACGVPVLCLDHQGAHDIVTPECGIKIPVTTRRQVVADLSASIRELANDPHRCRAMAAAAVARARFYHWEAQGERMEAIYNAALACHARASDAAKVRENS